MTLGKAIDIFNEEYPYTILTKNSLVRHISKLEGRLSTDYLQTFQSMEVELTDSLEYNLGEISDVLKVTVDNKTLNHAIDPNDSMGYYLSTSDDDMVLNLNKPMEGKTATIVYQVVQTDLDYDQDRNHVLLLPHPHDEVYITYLTAMHYMKSKEYTDYNNYMMLVESQLEQFAMWNAKRSQKGRKHFEVDI